MYLLSVERIVCSVMGLQVNSDAPTTLERTRSSKPSLPVKITIGVFANAEIRLIWPQIS